MIKTYINISKSYYPLNVPYSMLLGLYYQFLLCPSYWESIIATGNLLHFTIYGTLEASNNKVDKEG